MPLLQQPVARAGRHHHGNPLATVLTLCMSIPACRPCASLSCPWPSQQRTPGCRTLAAAAVVPGEHVAPAQLATASGLLLLLHSASEYTAGTVSFGCSTSSARSGVALVLCTLDWQDDSSAVLGQHFSVIRGSAQCITCCLTDWGEQQQCRFKAAFVHLLLSWMQQQWCRVRAPWQSLTDWGSSNSAGCFAGAAVQGCTSQMQHSRHLATPNVQQPAEGALLFTAKFSLAARQVALQVAPPHRNRSFQLERPAPAAPPADCPPPPAAAQGKSELSPAGCLMQHVLASGNSHCVCSAMSRCSKDSAAKSISQGAALHKLTLHKLTTADQHPLQGALEGCGPPPRQEAG